MAGILLELEVATASITIQKSQAQLLSLETYLMTCHLGCCTAFTGQAGLRE